MAAFATAIGYPPDRRLNAQYRARFQQPAALAPAGYLSQAVIRATASRISSAERA
jgi:hypothetical protein